MKKLLYILLAMALPLAVLSGCKKIDDPAFDQSASARVQALIDSTFATLTSSEEGWYFSDYTGFDGSTGYGGFWLWCKFNTNYMAEVASELNVSYPDKNVTPEKDEDGNEIPHKDIIEYPTGSKSTSGFSLIRGRGAVLSFDLYNSLLHYLADPDILPWQMDFEFTIVSVTDDLVTVRGIRTGKTMYLYRKTDGKDVGETLEAVKKLSDLIITPPIWNVEVAGAITKAQAEEWAADAPNDKYRKSYVGSAPTVTLATPIVESMKDLALARPFRVFTLTYSMDKGMEEADVEVSPGVFEKQQVHSFETTTVELPFIVSRTDSSISLLDPTTVAGNEFTAMTHAFDHKDEYGRDIHTLTSTDAGKTVKMTSYFLPPPPAITMEGVVGTYIMLATNLNGGRPVSHTVTITKKDENTVIITGVNNAAFSFEATINAVENRLEAADRQYTGYSVVGDGGRILFANEYGGPVFFNLIAEGVLESPDQWGFLMETANAWFNEAYAPGATFTRQ